MLVERIDPGLSVWRVVQGFGIGRETAQKGLVRARSEAQPGLQERPSRRALSPPMPSATCERIKS